MDEIKILYQLRRGNPDALKALMDCYQPYVSTVVWNILRGTLQPEDAEEVVSDVFLAAWEHAPSLEAGHIRGWLGTVARNKAKNRLRSVGKLLLLEEDEADIPAPDDPTDELLQQEKRRLVRRVLDSFPEEDRALFLRHYFYAQTVEEIAAALSLNVSTVKTRLRRGRAKLKESLRKEGFDETEYV